MVGKDGSASAYGPVAYSGRRALTISQLMGHADGSMLAHVYGHLDRNVDFLKKNALVD